MYISSNSELEMRKLRKRLKGFCCFFFYCDEGINFSDNSFKNAGQRVIFMNSSDSSLGVGRHVSSTELTHEHRGDVTVLTATAQFLRLPRRALG